MTSMLRMRDALMPLIKESEDAADWNDDKWLTPVWSFSIIDGDYRHSYSLGSIKNAPGAKTKYRAYLMESVPELVAHPTLAGNLFVSAYYTTGEGRQENANSETYNPAEGISIDDWVARFISEAKRHMAGFDTRRK